MMNAKISQKHDYMYHIRNNCALKSIYDDGNECINYALSLTRENLIKFLKINIM